MPDKPSVGGQAVLEGVMMKGPSCWAVAVRTPDGEIEVETHEIKGAKSNRRWVKVPFVRGVQVLVEQLAIGIKALRISANYQVSEEDREPFEKAVGWTLAIALVFFAAFFITAPALLSKWGGGLLGIGESDKLATNIFEGFIRIGFFVGYVLLISLLKDIRRVFQYHGAEHKTIYAYQNGDPFTPEVIDKYSTLHVRCGTNFLFIVLFLTIISHFVIDIWLADYVLAVRLAARIAAIPILAGVAYEVIKAASRQEKSLIFRIASLPGLALQKITTRPPDYDQIAVAVKAMQAVMAKEGTEQPGTA